MQNSSSKVRKRAMSSGVQKAKITLILASLITCSQVSVALADQASEFTQKVYNLIANLYNQAFVIITIAAALLVMIALCVRMTSNTQKASQATSWLIRIVVCYLAINCIGVIFNVINDTTKGLDYASNNREWFCSAGHANRAQDSTCQYILDDGSKCGRSRP